jgi:hypothetical protein
MRILLGQFTFDFENPAAETQHRKLIGSYTQHGGGKAAI